jgi:hypothetical protein
MYINTILYHIPSVLTKKSDNFFFFKSSAESSASFTCLLRMNKNQLKMLIDLADFNHFEESVVASSEKHFVAVKKTQISKFQRILETSINPRGDPPTTNDTKKWLVNLTETTIPEDVQQVLKLGDKFSVPILNKKIPVEDIISSVESTIYRFDDEVKIEIRNKFTNILTNFKQNPDKFSPHEVSFSKLHKKAQIFLKDHPELLVLSADKGNVTVIMNRIEYSEKVEVLLSDRSTYVPVEKDPTPTIQRKVNRFISKIQKTGCIEPEKGKALRSYASTIPHFYALPKIHKEGVPLRPIVSSMNGFTFNLSKFYVELLKPFVGKTHTWILNSWDFKQKISDVILPPGYVLISLDVVNLFTNIPNELVYQVIEENFDEIQEKAQTWMSYEEFLEGLDLILSNCFFSYDDRVFHQVFGSPMGSPVSPILANLVMEYVEDEILGRLDFIPPFFFRYVDDIITAVPETKVNQVLDEFNGFHERIKFTLEVERNDALPFLDLLVIRNEDGSLSTDWYHKSTWSGRYMDYLSWLPMSYKRNTVSLLTDKILRLSDEKFHEKNFALLVETLKANRYPLGFIRDNMRRRLDREVENATSSNVSQEPRLFLSVPYVKILHEKLKKFFSPYGIELVGRATNPLKGTLFSRTKGRIPLGNQSELIYEVPCECGKVYIGQTKQYLRERMKNHQDAIKAKNLSHSALSTHAVEANHKVNFDDVNIVAREARYGKRCILEMINIRKRSSIALNKQTDCKNLGTSYDHLF